MRWVVALGLRDHCRGALELAGWLSAPGHSTDGSDDQLMAVHAVSSPEYAALADRALSETVHAAGLDMRFDQLRVVEGRDLVRCLEEAVVGWRADAILIGRREHEGWPRLGGTGARLLRSLPAPMVVVPRQLRADAIPSGPILVATDLSADSVLATRFASHLSRRYGRELFVVHVVEHAPEWNFLELGAADPVRADAELRTRAQRSLQHWVQGLRLKQVPKLVAEQGDTLERLLDSIQHHQPLFTVVGSRRMGVLERVFSTSVGLELANHAPCPIAIVPPLPAEVVHRPGDTG